MAQLADIGSALKDAREIGHAPSLMYALSVAPSLNNYCGYYVAASKHADEMVIFATQKGVGFWKAYGMLYQSMASALLGNASDQKVARRAGSLRVLILGAPRPCTCQQRDADTAIPPGFGNVTASIAELGD